jgi:anaerobic magnesium-protoporphyrin IX monomethyl ester cyclase
MRIVFVHTPMSTVAVEQRASFWRNFDIQYHSTHPGLRHMKRIMWELPHWMTWLAGVLVAHDYDDLDVLDLYTEPGTFNEPGRLNQAMVDAAVSDHPGDVYLFSPMTPNLCYAFEIADAVKRTHPEAVVVFGGVVATPLAEDVARHASVDYVVFDRGELALPALLDALAGDGDVSAVGNLACRRPDGAVAKSRTHYPSMPVEDIPFPKVDLFPPEVGQDIRYLRQVYALGCPYKCTFCTIQTIGRRPSYFPIERVLKEVEAYRAQYGTHHNIYWGDETFTLYPDRTLRLLTGLEEYGTIRYDCQTRLNCLTDELILRKLKSSGCQWVEIGLETGVQGSHNTHKHRMKLDPTEETLLRMRDAGLAACAFTVNGFPDQSLDDMRRSIDWVCDLISKDLLQASYLFGLVPYPGSAMYADPERFGMRILHSDFRLYHEELPPVFSTAQASPDEIYEVFLSGVSQLAQAMAKSPYFGPPPPGLLSDYGTFWADAHV